MKNRIADFLKRLEADEGATVTVEWMLVICVALVVLTAIYYIARWATDSTGKAVKKVVSENPFSS